MKKLMKSLTKKTLAMSFFKTRTLKGNLPRLMAGQIVALIIFSLISCETSNKVPPPNKPQSEISKQPITELFLITSPKMDFLSEGKYGNREVGPHFVIQQDQAQVVEFTDRPYRLAKKMLGGMKGFTAKYEKSDFVKDPPNVTFVGNEENTGAERQTIIEVGQPFVLEATNGNDVSIVFPVQKAIGFEKMPPLGSYKNCSMVVDVLQFLPDIIESSSSLVDIFISMFEDNGAGHPSPATVTFTNKSGMTLQGYNSQVWPGTQLRDDKDSPMNFSNIVLEDGEELVFAMQGQGGLYGAGSGGIFMLASTDPIIMGNANFTMVVLFSTGYMAYCCTPSQNVAMEILMFPTPFWQSLLNNQSLSNSFLISLWNKQDPPQLWGSYSKGGWTPPANTRLKIGDDTYVGHGNFAKISKDADDDELKNTDEALVTFLIEKN